MKIKPGTIRTLVAVSMICAIPIMFLLGVLLCQPQNKTNIATITNSNQISNLDTPNCSIETATLISMQERFDNYDKYQISYSLLFECEHGMFLLPYSGNFCPYKIGDKFKVRYDIKEIPPSKTIGHVEILNHSIEIIEKIK